MKRIAIFCDGTWNAPERGSKTSVERLSAQIKSHDPMGVEQRSYYLSGIGTSDDAGPINRTIDQYGGGAFGWGLEGKIKTAYEKLAHVYVPGDEIFIFGFSRGAYTARSLGGLIRASGIPTQENLSRIDEAIARYKSRDEETHPTTEASAEWRWGFSPLVYTGREERGWRVNNGKPEGTRLTIAYIGVWDTVGALGVPGVLGALAKPFNAKYLFHDHQLSSSVQAGRHALATDEARPFYPPTLWQNLPKLNEGHDHKPFRQEWFPGNHGVVGGSGGGQSGRDRRGLSYHALSWIMEGAERAGLDVSETYRDEVQALRRIGAPLSHGRKPLWRKARKVTEHARDVATCTLHRLSFGGDDGSRYNPKTLRPLGEHLRSLLPSERDPHWR